MMPPPMMLMNTTSRPATASPRTNFEAPSMAPKNPDSSSIRLRRRRASLSPVSPWCLRVLEEAGGKVGIDRHLLARHGVEMEARGHFRDAAGALGDDHKI